MSMLDFFSDALNRQKEMGLLRTLDETSLNRSSNQDTKVIDFCSNDYLGYLSEEVEVRSNSGSGASRLLLQDQSKYADVEDALRKWQGSEAALIFPSGFQAGLALSALCSDEGIAVFSDELNHASLIDGLRLRKAKGPTRVYKHLDLGVLSNQLREHPDKTKVIVTESTFSMDGDSPNFSELVDICVRNNAALIVDESHSVGMHGNQGVGTLDLANIPAELCAFKIFGFGKALGLQGGAWCGPTLLKNFLVNFSRSHMYSTALSPLLLNLVKERIADIRTNNDRRIKLKTNLNFFYACMKHLLTPPRNASPIILVHLGREENVIDAETKFRNLGFYVRGVRYPTVAKGNARLRIIIRADHTTSQIKDFAECLCNFLEEKSRQEDINKYREFSNDSP